MVYVDRVGERSDAAEAADLMSRSSRNLLALVGIAVLAMLFWDTRPLWPVRMLVVLFHELGHALAALATGGEVLSISLSPDEGGVTHSRGGLRFFIRVKFRLFRGTTQELDAVVVNVECLAAFQVFAASHFIDAQVRRHQPLHLQVNHHIRHGKLRQIKVPGKRVLTH